jgi:polyisoprenyl-teichoic acid--peptidoglycan teichoic acid transferase
VNGRHRRTVFGLVLAGLVLWVAGATLGAFADGGSASASSGSAGSAPLLEIGKAHPAEAVPSLTGNKPIFILCLGSDARPGEPLEGERTDSIHILAINPAKKRASLVGFPRDSWVNIPGHGMDKINAALTYGGPTLTTKVIEDLTGIHMDYYAITGFGGMEAMIDGVHGLTIDVPTDMHDQYSKADFNAGVQHLNGHDVLAFSRDRHSLPNGDFGRSENQGLVFISTLEQFRKEFAKDPAELLAYVSSGMQYLQTDLPLSEVISLAFTATTINPKNVSNAVVPAHVGMQGAESIVNIDPSAKALYNDLKNDGILQKDYKTPTL